MKLIIALLAGSLCLPCCFDSLHGQPASQKPLIVTTASMFTDMAANIGGDLIEVASIVPIGGDPHIYEPTPGDVRLLLRANLILQNGFTFEGWIHELIQNSDTKASVHTITEGIDPIVSTMHQNATDPHAWMEPVNGKIYALNIKNALVALLPNHATQINAQYEAYAKKLDELDAYIREQISRIDPGKRVLITSHDSFHYYGKRYGMQLESVLGTSTDADVRTSDLVRLNEVIREKKIPAVFIESTINPKLLEQVASDNKIRIGGKLYSDSLGDEDSPANTYINMLKQNTDVIVSGLTGTSTAEETGNTLRPKRFPLLWLILGVILFAVAGGLWWKKSQAS
jgi:ABC-type Zn uptake system ZnuABC Zn-binding protein ZnuA